MASDGPDSVAGWDFSDGGERLPFLGEFLAKQLPQRPEFPVPFRHLPAGITGDPQVDVHVSLFVERAGQLNVARLARVDQVIPVFVAAQSVEESAGDRSMCSNRPTRSAYRPAGRPSPPCDSGFSGDSSML